MGGPVAAGRPQGHEGTGEEGAVAAERPRGRTTHRGRGRRRPKEEGG